MSLKWFEKTVEYDFVATVVLLKGRTFLCPFDGQMEILGDSVFVACDRWLLIEFKKDLKSIDSEKDKFYNYIRAKNDLEREDQHHYLIYGHADGNNVNDIQFNFSLRAETYFSRREIESINESGLEQLCNAGSHQDVFLPYLFKFLKYKLGGMNYGGVIVDNTPPDPGGGGGGAILDLSIVAGISHTNQSMTCISLREFLSMTAYADIVQLMSTPMYKEIGDYDY